MYIRCTLTPLACCHETDEAPAGADAAAALLDGDWQKGSTAQVSHAVLKYEFSKRY